MGFTHRYPWIICLHLQRTQEETVGGFFIPPGDAGDCGLIKKAWELAHTPLLDPLELLLFILIRSSFKHFLHLFIVNAHDFVCTHEFTSERVVQVCRAGQAGH